MRRAQQLVVLNTVGLQAQRGTFWKGEREQTPCLKNILALPWLERCKHVLHSCLSSCFTCVLSLSKGVITRGNYPKRGQTHSGAIPECSMTVTTFWSRAFMCCQHVVCEWKVYFIVWGMLWVSHNILFSFNELGCKVSLELVQRTERSC